ncbi:DBH-like monooxygenase protein 1 [Porites lutea]|uniref:DBH-like monooxygenase protein 1 n=1 Tax=Porites lutea TaxID=51062 RepID=UPI003CC662D7
METHYDNPLQRTDFVDSSGLRFWYTERTRMYDSAVIFSGWDVSNFMMIPPKQKVWKITGSCPSACIKKGLEKSPLPGNKIKIFAALLHTHLAGRKVRVHHLRNGKELKQIVYDNHYDFNFQEYQTLKEEVEVFPLNVSPGGFLRQNEPKRFDKNTNAGITKG